MLGFGALAPQGWPSAAPGAGAQTQSRACANLQAQIRALGGRPSNNAARYQRAAAQQRQTLARTVAYAEQRGCNRQQFLFFGSPPPPQCGPINARIASMRANLSKLESMAQQADSGRQAQQRALMARYDSQCRQQRRVHVNPQERGFFERMFGADQPRYREVPIQPPPEAVIDPTPRGGPKAVCVRTCDGGFFPVSYSARRSTLHTLSEMCAALCPNAETRVFTYRPGASIEEAIAADGQPYTELPNAGRFQTAFDPACTCRPEGKSWAKTLRRAEQLLDNRSSRVIIVTVEKANKLSQPRPAATPRQERASGANRAGRDAAPDDEAERQRQALEADGEKAAIEAQNAPAGLNRGDVTRRSVYSLDDGERQDVIDASGTVRRVRIIAPTL